MTAAPNDAVPAWRSLLAIAVGLWGLRNGYSALTTGESTGGRAPPWGTVRYYERATQPVRYWFFVAVNLVMGATFVVGGVILLFFA